MATSYNKEDAKSKLRKKSERAGKASRASQTILGSALAGQDPPIIIKPGGSLDLVLQNSSTSDNYLVDKRKDKNGHQHYEHNEKTYKLKRMTFLDIASGNETDVKLPSAEYAILLYYFT